jgi:elongator complex protein 3
LEELIYPAAGGQEHFLSYVTPDDRIAGFLRLYLPGEKTPDTGLADLKAAAIIREVHVYGQSLEVGAVRHGAAQHSGLGTQLIQRAEEITRQAGYSSLAVISAVGTRGYYLNRGFERGELYLVNRLSSSQNLD